MLTAFRSNTPSFASCSKVTNLVVSSPRLFSCLLGVCGCSESPTAPSSPLLLADSSSIITQDQLRTSPPASPTKPRPASPRKARPNPAVRQTEGRGKVCDSKQVANDVVRPGLLQMVSLNRREWAECGNSMSEQSVGESRWPREV